MPLRFSIDSPFKTSMACNHCQTTRIASQLQLGALPPSWINGLNLPKHHLGSGDWHLVVMTLLFNYGYPTFPLVYLGRCLGQVPLDVSLTASWGVVA